jgi:hypothetical protein
MTLKPHEIHTNPVPVSACPSCGVKMAAATGGPGKPTAGAISLCVYCRAVLTFTADLQLRLLSNAEWAALPIDQRTELTRLREGLAVLARARKKAGSTRNSPPRGGLAETHGGD